jgi:hypothetical protein
MPDPTDRPAMFPAPIPERLLLLELFKTLVLAGVPDADIPARLTALVKLYAACEYDLLIGRHVRPAESNHPR